MTGSVVLDTFRVLAACTSLMMILSPIPTVYHIHKTHKTGHMSMFPLLAVVANCHIWMMYGYLDENFFPVFNTFVVGDLISISYIVIFYRWSSKRSKANKLLAIFGAALVAATMFNLLGGFGYTGQTRHQVATIAGYFAIVTSLVLYSSPLGIIVTVFKYKSAVFLPIHMIIAGTTNNLVWVIYASLAGKWIAFTPNFITLLLGIFQIVVYFFVYNPKSHLLGDDWKEHQLNEREDDDNCVPTPMDEDADLESPTFVSIETPKVETSVLPPHELVIAYVIRRTATD